MLKFSASNTWPAKQPLVIKGKYSDTKVFTDLVDDETISQVVTLLSQEFVQGAKIRIMPDCHAGMGCVIGFTADLGDKVVPALVGVDIGCGVLTLPVGPLAELDFDQLDRVVRKHIPVGFEVQEKEVNIPYLEDLRCLNALGEKAIRRVRRSPGTLGGGNHFIEVAVDSQGNCYLMIHTGSRYLGNKVAEHYQNLALEFCSANSSTRIPKDLCYLTGSLRDDYLRDMKICQQFASDNRMTILKSILARWLGEDYEIWHENKRYKLTDSLDELSFETIHNYIDFRDNIVRKGAVSAREGEPLIIPINMRDGSLFCIGKGNLDWNYSAPHGAGRIMSRSEARRKIPMEEYEKSMRGIYSTTVNKSTLDEAPMAYKPLENLMATIHDTVELIDRYRPVYNFKASE